MFFPPAKLPEKDTVLMFTSWYGRSTETEGCAGVPPGFELDSKTQSQFLNSTSEAQMSDFDKMEETNVFANWEKGVVHGNASFPF